MNDHELYRFYSEAETLLYVGITDSAARRISEHRRDKPWWREVSRIEIERHESREELRRAEIEAIVNGCPRYNIVHANASTGSLHLKSPARPIPWSEAFAPPTHTPRGGRVHYPLPCPGCGVAALTQALDVSRQPVDDRVRCELCLRDWEEAFVIGR